MELPPRPTLFDFHGVSMTKYFTNSWDEIQNFNARPDDILMVTYPKAGSTWINYILDLLYFGQTRPERQESIPLHERVPFLEISKPSLPAGKDLADQLPTTPRLIKTHLPVQFVPKSFWEQNCRMVYVARNAKDNAVSYYHFGRMNNVMPEPGDWSTFLQNFMEGKVVFGSWYDHVTTWWEKKQSYSKLHYMFYEDLLKDTGQEIDRLCSFLGLCPSAEEKERVFMKDTFMKEQSEDGISNEHGFRPVAQSWVVQMEKLRAISDETDTTNVTSLGLMDAPLQHRPALFDFHGVGMTNFFTENWENLQNFQARPDDIIIASYPKAGCTWLSYILDLLYFGQTFPERDTSVPLYARVNNLEIVMPATQPGSSKIKGTDILDNLLTSPRVLRTHLPVQFFPKSFWEENCKIVYVARNAKDTVVSYFHFQSMAKIFPEPGDWSSYPHRFMDGKMVFGSWYDHVNGWWEKKQSYQNLHYMFYEDMIEDTGREIDKLCSFLGLSRSAEEKETVTGRVQFDDMKGNSMVNNSSLKILDIKESLFMRKGKVGDWKNHFTVAQSEEFDEDYKKKMKNPTLQFRTEV